MLDLKFVRENPEVVKQNIKKGIKTILKDIISFFDEFAHCWDNINQQNVEVIEAIFKFLSGLEI